MKKDHDGAILYDMLTPKPKELLQKRRNLVKKGEITMWSNNEKMLKKRYLFLFQDLLLITKKEFTSRYWLKILISLKPSIKAELFKNSKYKIPNVEFRIYCPTTTFALFGKDKEEAETWVREIQSRCGGIQESPEEVKKEENNEDIQKYNRKTGEHKSSDQKLNIDEHNSNLIEISPPPYTEVDPNQKQEPQLFSIDQLFSLNPQPTTQHQPPPPYNPTLVQPNLNQQPIITNPLYPNTNSLFLDQPLVMNHPTHVASPVVAFESNGLIIVFEFPKKENDIIFMDIKITNGSSVPISNFSVMLAAPTYVQMRMEVASGSVVPPNNSGYILQCVKLMNTSPPNPILIKMKIDGQQGTNIISHIVDVLNFPQNL